MLFYTFAFCSFLRILYFLTFPVLRFLTSLFDSLFLGFFSRFVFVANGNGRRLVLFVFDVFLFLLSYLHLSGGT